MHNNLCIIPARGGSKRIPRKNIKDFLGKPIISYSIETALQSGLFEEVMVSTDDIEIAEIAENRGAKVPFLRSSETSDDFAGTFHVIEEVIEEYSSRGKTFKNICCIYPTSPLLDPNTLKSGLKLLTEGNFTSVFPVVKFSYPILRSLRLEKGNRVAMNFPEYQSQRSQDLPESYHDAGQFYWCNCSLIRKEGQLFTQNSAGLVLNEMQVQDIDNLTDWELTELKYQITRKRG